MAKTKISEFSPTPANNTDIDNINIAEGCAPSGINDAIRELMSQLKDFQAGTAGDSFNGPIGTSTAAAGAFTTLTASSTATLNTLASSGATLTGGTINGMAIGGTTAAAGAFTTLAASGAVTLSGGTANGVTYLNGSKVLTSGSALTFDGAGTLVSGLGGSGTNNSLLRLNGSDASSYGSYLQFQRNGVNKWTIGTDSGINGGTSDDLTIFGSASQRFYASSAEQMRLTSTGLGIGTSSPLAKLHVRGATNGNLLVRGGASAASGLTGTALSSINDAASATVSLNFEGSDFNFVENNAVVAKLDSSGNLGIGTSSPVGKLHVSAATVASDIISANTNIGISSSNKFGFAIYEGSSEVASFRYFRDGTGNSQLAGSSALLFNSNGAERARIDSSGELMVGTTAGYNGEKFIVGYSGNGMALRNGGSGTLNDVVFLRGTSTVVGTIQTTASSTLYNVTSDYRLKNIDGPVTNSGAFIDKLNPVQGSWKVDGSRFIGFLAHELQEASETTVGGGVKDGDEMQSIDYSNAELIANMAAELKSLRQRLAAAGIA